LVLASSVKSLACGRAIAERIIVTMKGSLAISFLALAVAARAAATTACVGWPETIELLAQERSQAETCVQVLKSSSDKSAIASARLTYGAAKAQADGVIAGLTVALVQGGEPDTLPEVLTRLKEAGAGLQEVCDSALKTVSEAGGNKGVVEEVLKAPIEPIVNAISSAVSAIWTRQVEQDKLALETIRAQLEAAKWPDFGEVAPLQ
jgi:hypothetical protein